MNHDLLNILSHSNKDIDNQKLMDYVSGKLAGPDKHEVEKWMVENDFSMEALEGLQQFNNAAHLQLYVDQLNKELNVYLRQKKQRRERKRIKDASWIYFSIILVLLLIILAYVIIRKLES